jgi:hypothetical protein
MEFMSVDLSVTQYPRQNGGHNLLKIKYGESSLKVVGNFQFGLTGQKLRSLHADLQAFLWAFRA